METTLRKMSTVLRIFWLYLLAGVGWILLFHFALLRFTGAPSLRHHVYWEELGFLLAGGVIFYFLIRKANRLVADSGEALRKEQATVESIIETSPIGITAVDRSGRIIFANTQAEQVLGLTRENITARRYDDPGWRITDINGEPFPEEDLPFSRVLRTRESVYNVEHAIEWPDGRRVLLSVNGSPLFNAAGDMYRVIFAIADITEQKEAARQLRETTERLHALIDASPLAIAMMTPAGEVDTVWNRAAEQMFGHTRQEVEGRQFLDLPDQRQAGFLEILRRVSRGESFTDVELPHRTGAGEFMHIMMHIAPVCNEAGAIVNVMAVLEDITEQKRTGRVLKLQDAALRAAANGILITDVGGTIQWANKAMEQLTGFTVKEMKGQTPRLWRSGRHHTDFYRELWETILQGSVWHGEIVNTRKDDTEYTEEMTITPVKDDQGIITNFIAIKQDITPRKQYLSEIEQSRKQLRALTTHLQRIRENERAKIARELHDEFGQQITALKLTLELISRKMQKALPAEEAAPITVDIRRMGEHIDGILDEVRDLVSWLRPKALDNLGLLSAIEWHLEEFQHRTGIRCSLSVEKELPTLNQVQEVAIFRILQEGLTNVLRHAKASEVQVSVVLKNDQLQLTLRDNGVGMPDGARDHAMSFGILGMQERAADFGGEITIESTPDSGTAIRLQMPLE